MAEKKEQKLWAGKYKTPEEMEKGLANLVADNQRIKQEAEQRAAALSQAQAAAMAQEKLNQKMADLLERTAAQQVQQTQPSLIDPDTGQMNVDAFLQYQQKRDEDIRSQISSIPNMVNEQFSQLLAPLASAQEAQGRFFSREDIDKRFDPVQMQAVLARNTGLRKMYDLAMAQNDPSLQEEGIKTVYAAWKETVGPLEQARNAIDASAKLSATEPNSSGGPPPVLPGDGQADQEKLHKLADRAQTTGTFLDRQAYLKEHLKGSSLEGALSRMKEQAIEAGWNNVERPGES